MTIRRALEQTSGRSIQGQGGATESRLVRVCHVAFGLDMGGLEKLLVEFARHADRRRFDLRFVSIGWRGRLADEIESQGWPVEAMGEPSGLKPSLVLRLARLFRRWKIDVVHTHDNRPLFYAAPAARLAGVRQVIHTRHGLSFGASSREQRVFHFLTGLTSRVVCVSADCQAATIQSGVAADRVQTIWNGIDLSRFAYNGPTATGPVVAVARLSPEKDLKTLVRAIGIASAIDPELRLDIAGDGPCRTDLERLIGELDLGERVRLLGEIRDVPALLAQASVFALSSISEGVSLTLLEAMARGLPVVATQVGGNPEVVVEGETGRLIPPRDPEALAAAIQELRKNPEFAHRMGLAGRRRVETHFNVRRMVADYESLYHN